MSPFSTADMSNNFQKPSRSKETIPCEELASVSDMSYADVKFLSLYVLVVFNLCVPKNIALKVHPYSSMKANCLTHYFYIRIVLE